MEKNMNFIQFEFADKQLTLDEFDAWIEREIRGFRAGFIARGDVFRAAEVEKPVITKTPTQASKPITKQSDKCHTINFTGNDIRFGDYSKHLTVTNLQRLIADGISELRITYWDKPWKAKKDRNYYEAVIYLYALGDQNSITITMKSENVNGYLIDYPNPDTKWGSYFVEVNK